MSNTPIAITVSTSIKLPVKKVWDLWTTPHHIIHWNQASADWQTTTAENDLRKGGKFCYRMESKDEKYGFDFNGTHTEVVKYKSIESLLGDGRKLSVSFKSSGDSTEITEVFDAEKLNSPEMQKTGWQAILNSFRKYAELCENASYLHFETEIKAGKRKVYKTMLEEKTYREWTSVFNSTSHYKGSWQKNSRILFLGTDEKGYEAGMVSRIKENIENEFISIEHIGIIKNGREILCGQEVDKWKGALENYTLKTSNGKTIVSVDIDSGNDFISYFGETWPKALSRLKEICEK
jgi:uncharacterized protein YndB with AHSA1/START domain